MAASLPRVLRAEPCHATTTPRRTQHHRALMASNAETNIAKALELKAQGNEAFKAADYKQAMVHYHQVARHATVPKHARKQLTPASRQRDSRAHAPVAAPPTCRIATRAPCRPCATTHQHARRSGLLRRLEPTPVGCAPTRVRAWCVQIYMYVHGFSEGSGAGGGQSMPGQTTKPVITHPSPVVRPSFTRRSPVVHSSFTRRSLLLHPPFRWARRRWRRSRSSRWSTSPTCPCVT